MPPADIALGTPNVEPDPSEVPLHRVSLSDKYTLEEGRIFLTGIQALVRLPFDQHRADRAAGLTTRTFISGYQGSPLGGLDKEILRNRRIAEEHGVYFQPALNEELGATAVWGSQLAPGIRGANVDGVVGFWYGKNPGLDRAADAIRHANFCGTPRTGGAVALIGDDPSCKSSTLPSASEPMCASLQIPVLFPGSVEEVLELGRHAIGISRASGLWSGLKIVTNVADAVGNANVSAHAVAPVFPEVEYNGRPYVHRPNGTMLAPDSMISERNLVTVRLQIARLYGRLNGLNRVTATGGASPWLGIVAPGKTYYDVMQAFQDLGLGTEDALASHGIRIFKVGMPWPLERDQVREFADGLSEVLVVEEKGPFLETHVKEALYGVQEPPRVVGKFDEEDRGLLRLEGELDADLVARAIGKRLLEHHEIDSVRARLRTLEEAGRFKAAPLPVMRTPFFCSGCPHNSSTVAADDALVGAGIGCHTMILLNREGRGQITGITQMGGEGSQWIGMSPFVDAPHFVQNIGDGTFHHSGSLAVRASVAAGTNITYKIFYNATVAMTGGQDVEGGMSVPDLTRWLALEGVKRVVVTTEDLEDYRGVALDPIASVRPREDMQAVQDELAKIPGTTVLIHDQGCAAELRRKRKRGKAPEPVERIHINERVCEGCGDCGKKSSCLSVLPVETEFGRKTQIHQPSCNKDYSCLEGDCPSFLQIIPPTGKRAKPAVPEAPADLPEPVRIVPDKDFVLRMIGIGGTGVVTVSQILAMAAHLEGKHTSGLDQTGLSQKGGPVVSDLKISVDPIVGANKAGGASVDLYLGLDLLGAGAQTNLQTADPSRTVAVVSTSAVPTGRMVVDTDVRFPSLTRAMEVVNGQTRSEHNVWLDAQALSERVFGDHMPTNMVCLGAAYQRGALPVSATAMEEAIRLNGAAVDKNIGAFRWGRAAVAAPDAVAALEQSGPAALPPTSTELDDWGRSQIAFAPEGSELRRVLEIRVPELVAYQDRAYAERYARFVAEVAELSTPVAEAVARGLYKFMAYKDEYEVARLHLDAVEIARRDAEFGPGTKFAFKLHPPALRALGMDRKLTLGAWFVPMFRLMYRMRRLRKSRLDPFGRAEVRRVERALVGEYEAMIRGALTKLTPATEPTVVALAELADVVRGYEDIKLANVETYRAKVAELEGKLEAGETPGDGRPDSVLPIIALRG